MTTDNGIDLVVYAPKPASALTVQVKACLKPKPAGGKGKLAAAVRALESVGLDDEIPVAALAKSFEEVFVPDYETKVEVQRG